MNTRITLIISSILLLVAILAGMALWARLPEQMASHWNEADQVDGYMSRFWGIFLMPIVAAGMLLLFLVIPQIDPLKANIAKFRGYFNTFILLFMIFLLYMHGLTLAWNLGYNQFRMGAAMLPALGLFFIYAGVMISKARRNWFIGIRTPWTLSSDKVWDETHRLGSKMFIGAGVLSLLGVFFPDYMLWFFMIPIFGAALVPVVYSYILFRREEKT